MIVKVVIQKKDKTKYTILFGTSYKTWLDQIKDYSYRTQKWIGNKRHPTYKVVSVETSRAAWKSWGGLKWCEEKDFQEELNREGCQKGEPDNPNPRKYSEMKFKKSYYALKKIKTFYTEMYSNRELVNIGND
jgi:hypothetical protein